MQLSEIVEEFAGLPAVEMPQTIYYGEEGPGELSGGEDVYCPSVLVHTPYYKDLGCLVAEELYCRFRVRKDRPRCLRLIMGIFMQVQNHSSHSRQRLYCSSFPNVLVTKSTSDLSKKRRNYAMLQPRAAKPAMTALRNLFTLPHLQCTSRFPLLRTSIPTCISCTARAFSTGSIAAFGSSTHTNSSQGYAIWRSIAGLLGKLERRPGLEIIRPDLSRGMKVRSSVKKLCEGCKVGASAWPLR